MLFLKKKKKYKCSFVNFQKIRKLNFDKNPNLNIPLLEQFVGSTEVRDGSKKLHGRPLICNRFFP